MVTSPRFVFIANTYLRHRNGTNSNIEVVTASVDCQSTEMALGKKCWGIKIVKVPTAREASKIFTDHTFLIGPEFDKTLKKRDKQVTEVPTVHSNFQKFKCRRGAPAPCSSVAPSLSKHAFELQVE